MMHRSFSADRHPGALRFEYPGGSPFFAKEWRTMRVRDGFWRTSELSENKHQYGGFSANVVDSALSFGAHRNLPPYSTESSTIGGFHYAQAPLHGDLFKDNWYMPPMPH